MPEGMRQHVSVNVLEQKVKISKIQRKLPVTCCSIKRSEINRK